MQRSVLHSVAGMPYILFVAAAFFWSGNFVLGRLMHTEIPPVALAFWRWTGAALIALSLARPHLRQDWQTLRYNWRVILLLSLLGIAMMNTLLYAGLRLTTVVNASLLMALMPALILIFTWLFFKERIRPDYGVGIILSLSGACLVIGQGKVTLFNLSTWNQGDLLVLLAAAVFAAYSVAMRLRPAVHPLSLMAVTFGLGALLLLPVWGWEVASGHVIKLSGATLLTLAYLMLFPSVIAYFCFNRCIELIGSVRAGFCIHLVPLFSSAIGIVLLGESFVWYHATGAALIAVGILLATPLAGTLMSRLLLVWRRRRHRQNHNDVDACIVGVQLSLLDDFLRR